MKSPSIKAFQNLVWQFFTRHKRDFLWRTTNDSYAIVVSEIMLQQTQVKRVEPKFKVFLEHFPNFSALASASLSEILRLWQGLGYNRRAQALHQLAKIVMAEYHGQLPQTVAELEQLPGLGRTTARSVYVFAYNQPTVFIETNIRRVYLYHFFADQSNVADGQLLPLIEQTLSQTRPREWYWALMDYGTYLAQVTPNPNRRSKHYTKQAPFLGSRRQLRGQILAWLIAAPRSSTDLARQSKRSRNEVDSVLAELEGEKLIKRGGQNWTINS